MRSVLRQFVLSRDAGSDPDEVLRLPGSAFAVSNGTRSITLRRLWLDTFDWRLYRSGLALEQVSSRGETHLLLTGRDGTVIAAAADLLQGEAGPVKTPVEGVQPEPSHRYGPCSV